MSKINTKYADMTVEEKTKKVERKIKVLFREVPKERKQFVEALIYQFAVTTVTLERLVEVLNSGDILENFEQGSQKFMRENPALKSYNTTIKSFTALSNQLLSLLPATAKSSAGDELMSFITKPQGAEKP
jgi:hypothetical protein